MFIHSLYYKDHSTGWTLGTPDEPMLFDRLTLLVGASGVGKTQTLKAILNLQKIANGESLNGVEWDVVFSLDDGNKCRWCGAFETLEGVSSDFFSMVRFFVKEHQVKEFKIEREQMYLDNICILSRDRNNILFENKEMPKLSSKESLLFLLKEENMIMAVHKSFESLIGYREGYERHLVMLNFNNEKFENVKNEHSLLNSKLSITDKLFVAYLNKMPIFDEIINAFRVIFPTVESVIYSQENFDYTTPVFNNFYFLKIKEINVDSLVYGISISSGMALTLFYLATIFLCSDNSLILIDEFENSLGINCIDEVTSSILSQNRNLQFILTSHHPYIINHISSEHWKILTRKGGVVKAHNAKDVGIGKSKHAAFTQLINLDMYNTGMEE